MYKRPSLSLAVLAVATFGLAACQDTATSPVRNAPEAEASALRPADKGPRMTIATSSVTTVLVYPTYDNVYVSSEGHRLVIPANSICNPVTSGYGPAYWDKPCQTATAPILFTISSSTGADGRPRIDVAPDVRFSPNKTVVVEFKDQLAANAYGSLIEYCPTLGGPCIDEAKTDPSLWTHKHPVTGKVSRRIKHFSGYHVILGVDCDPYQDPSCSGEGDNGGYSY